MMSNQFTVLPEVEYSLKDLLDLSSGDSDTKPYFADQESGTRLPLKVARGEEFGPDFLSAVVGWSPRFPEPIYPVVVEQYPHLCTAKLQQGAHIEGILYTSVPLNKGLSEKDIYDLLVSKDHFTVGVEIDLQGRNMVTRAEDEGGKSYSVVPVEAVLKTPFGAFYNSGVLYPDWNREGFVEGPLGSLTERIILTYPDNEWQPLDQRFGQYSAVLLSSEDKDRSTLVFSYVLPEQVIATQDTGEVR
jgi:hypothetical protein